MRRLSDRFAEDAAACARLSDLAALVAEAAGELGFHFFALLEHASLRDPSGELVRIDNYPDAWVRELLATGDVPGDPVHLASRRASSGFSWRDLSSLIALEPHHRQILERSRAFGFGDGFTVPSNVFGEPAASCSFVTRRDREMPVTRLRCAELVGLHALTASRRLLRPTSSRTRPRLSRREIQCLRLVAQGKTDWEIATILSISVETVHQYLKRARAAYDVVSRTQLVVHALRDAWIAFEDVIPPSSSSSRPGGALTRD
ncbi:MAG TPA: LuxR family transcriptional regulator [Sphingomicrobium sp.]|nr:LuxR family transcriptional regulator [Sphingomicrobium sp.]